MKEAEIVKLQEIPRKTFKSHEFKKGCLGKIKYSTKTAADYVLSQMRGSMLNVYKCKYGEHYHIGNDFHLQKKKKKKSSTNEK